MRGEQPYGGSDGPIANGQEFFRKHGSIKLSQSKTSIIEVPLMHADEYWNLAHACGCPACIKCREYYPVSSSLQSKPTVNVYVNASVFEDDTGQNEISNDAFENFIQPKPSAGSSISKALFVLAQMLRKRGNINSS